MEHSSANLTIGRLRARVQAWEREQFWAPAGVDDELTAISLERCALPPRELMLARIAALIAVDAPPASYMADAGAAAEWMDLFDGTFRQDILDAIGYDDRVVLIIHETGTAQNQVFDNPPSICSR